MRARDILWPLAMGIIVTGSLTSCRTTGKATGSASDEADREVILRGNSPQVARFATWLDQLDKTMKGCTPKDAAELLVAENARETAFSIQALGRLYSDQDPRFVSLRLTYKKLEDTIGEYAKWVDMLNHANSEQSEQAVKDRLSSKRDAARTALETFLVSSNLVPSDPDAASYNQTFRSFLNGFVWKDASTDREDMLNAIRNELEVIKTTPYDFSHLEEGNGIHDFRHKVRWINREVRSLNGMIVLNPNTAPCSVTAYAGLINDPISKTKYAVLPGAVTEPNPAFITPCLYIEMAKIVDVVGLIKGIIEVAANIGTSGEPLDSVKDTDKVAVQKS
ncbi:MAG: hypothetical protein H7249_16640 [Chitinophagaceae bacterium]|nr:hypothetical protein [Oligoflexus sp.]